MIYTGVIGVVVSVEQPPDSGKWVDVATEYEVRGNILRASITNFESATLKDGIKMNNRFSVILSKHLMDKISYIVYLQYLGTRFEITSIEEQYPRVFLTIGGVYNGPTPITTTP